jgi:hypothetical protein
MAITKTATKIVDAETAAASSSVDSDGMDLSSAIDLAIGFEMTFNASATEGARIELYGDQDGASSSFTIGANQEATDEYDVAVSAGNTVSGVIPMIRSPKYAKVRVVNEDGTYSITAISVWSQVQTA